MRGTFETDFDGATGDDVLQTARLFQVYLQSDPKSTGRVTVPVLSGPAERNHRLQRILPKSSACSTAFDGLTGNDLDFWPATLREEIEEVNADIYQNVNNGFTGQDSQHVLDAYEQAVSQLFASLDSLELRLNGKRYLLGNTLTEADWRLFTTLVRFDAVYFGHFKCNIRRIADYPALSGFMRELYQIPSISNTVNMKHIKYHYYASHLNINPTGIVPVGPEQDFMRPMAVTISDRLAVKQR